MGFLCAIGTLKASWKASKAPRGRSVDPTLYSSNHLSRRLRWKFSTALPKLLWLLLVYNLCFLIFAVVGASYEIKNELWFARKSQQVALVFINCVFALLLLVQSILDLHARRTETLSPRRICISSAVGLFLLVVAFATWTTCYTSTVFYLIQHCPNNWYHLYDSIELPIWHTPAIDFSIYLPFCAAADTIFYVLYHTFGVCALIRDNEKVTIGLPYHSPAINAGSSSPDRSVIGRFRLKIWSRKAALPHTNQSNSAPTQDEIYAKYADSGSPSIVTSIELPESERSSPRGDNHTEPGSLLDSSIANVSAHTATTMQPSTGVSSSLVTPNSVRSSALISSASSGLPAYSGRSSASHSGRQSLHESLSQPEPAILRA